MVEKIKFQEEEKGLNLPYPSSLYKLYFMGAIFGISLIMTIFSFIYLSLGYKIVWGLLFLGTFPPMMRLN